MRMHGRLAYDIDQIGPGYIFTRFQHGDYLPCPLKRHDSEPQETKLITCQPFKMCPLLLRTSSSIESLQTATHYQLSSCRTDRKKMFNCYIDYAQTFDRGIFQGDSF